MLIATLLSLAGAADHEISLELGNLHNGDTAFDLFSRNDVMPSRGVRAGVAVHDRVAVMAGWHRVRRGAAVYSADEYLFNAAYFANEWTVGVKADVELAPWLLPYVKADAMLYQATMRFDDQPNDRDNAGQVQASALAPGGLFLGGAEIRIPKESAPFTLAWHIEAGYGIVASHAYTGVNAVGTDDRGGFADDASVGEMAPHGFALRSGLGIRF
jgi:hypothetical protein